MSEKDFFILIGEDVGIVDISSNREIFNILADRTSWTGTENYYILKDVQEIYHIESPGTAKQLMALYNEDNEEFINLVREVGEKVFSRSKISNMDTEV